ncbi:MAG: 30S ribosomal protein S1 [Bacillota bacterium]
MLKPEGYTVQADSWERLHGAMESGAHVEAVVERVTWPDGQSPVWELSFPDYPGVRGLVPSSETGVSKDQMPRFVGQAVRVVVKGLDREHGLAACSRREAVAEAWRRIWETYREGQVVDAVVRAVLPPSGDGKGPRVLLDVGGGALVEVPRAKATRSRVLPLREALPPGRQVKAKVTRVDPQAGVLEVSVVDAEPDPWEGLDYRRGDFVSGTVAYCDSRHVFVEVRPGVVGLAPPPLRGTIRAGDRVSCAVASFSREEKKLRLRLRGKLE